MRVPIGLLCAVATLTLWSSAEAGEAPRYSLKPGQVLNYEEDQSFQGGREDSHYVWSRTFWVVGRNEDGSWTVVVREALKDKPKASWRDMAREAARLISKQPARPETAEIVTYARFALRPDGTIPPCATLGTRIDLSHVFPLLPRDEDQAARGWRAHDAVDDATTSYAPIASNGAATFDFEADQKTYMETIYEGSDRRVFHFDRATGLIARAEIARSYAGHMKTRGTGTLNLVSVEDRDLATFAAEMGLFFDAQLAYERLYGDARAAGDRAEALLASARAALADARAKVTLAEPIAALDEQIKNHDTYIKSYIDNINKFSAMIGHLSPDWEVEDLEGRTHSPARYRGRVVVLDFWYRGCGWCMRAMPQVKGVAAHYRDRPVSVFGASNDPVEDDARFVAKTMGLAYPVLLSRDLPGKYGVQGFPTLVIIDRDGKVADVHVGYSPRLFDEVRASIDRLLDAK